MVKLDTQGTEKGEERKNGEKQEQGRFVLGEHVPRQAFICAPTNAYTTFYFILYLY